MRAQLLVLVSSLPLVTTPAFATEICGNGIDESGDGIADLGCWPAAATKICESPHSCSVTGDVALKSGGIVYNLKPDIDPKVAYGPSIPFIRRYHSRYEPGGSAPQYRTAAGSHWQHNWQSWVDKSARLRSSTSRRARTCCSRTPARPGASTITRRKWATTSSTCVRRRRARTTGSSGR